MSSTAAERRPSELRDELPKAEPDEAALRDILGAAPVGLEVLGASGERVWANLAADDPAHGTAGDVSVSTVERHGPGGETRTLQARRREVAVEGRRYTVTATSDVSDARRLQDDLFQRAYFDELTGRPNQALFDQAVEHLIAVAAPHEPFAIVVFDVDAFSDINDFYGRTAGDGLLAKIAQRIASELRASDMLARTGDDEFSLLLAPVEGAEGARIAVERILARLREPFGADGYEVFVSVSAGMSLFPDHGDAVDGLRGKALLAVAQAKRDLPGRLSLYDPSAALAQFERARLEQSLRLSLRDRQFLCAFQPKVDFRAGKVVGAEVLLRWRDGEGRTQPPGDLIALALNVGLINDVARQMLDKTLAALEDFDALYGPGLPIGFNIAAKQAGDVAFMRAFVEELEASGSARRFIIELTEEAFLQARQFQTHVLPLLRRVGARISIDDFGVGYSSLSTLADITADEIKVDRSFITGIPTRPRSQSLLRAIESIGDALGMNVMVEGVETEEEFAYLRDHTHIRVAQGFYFGEPFIFDALGPPGAAPRADDARSPAISRPPTAARPAYDRRA